MKLTLDIDTNSQEALALLAYIRSLQFVRITEEESFQLTGEQKAAIDKGLESFKRDGGLSHEQVMESTRSKFPHLFEKRA